MPLHVELHMQISPIRLIAMKVRGKCKITEGLDHVGTHLPSLLRELDHIPFPTEDNNQH